MSKGKLSLIFSLACILLKFGGYSTDFQKGFQAKNPCDCSRIKSNQIAGSANALKHFHF